MWYANDLTYQQAFTRRQSRRPMEGYIWNIVFLDGRYVWTAMDGLNQSHVAASNKMWFGRPVLKLRLKACVSQQEVYTFLENQIYLWGYSTKSLEALHITKCYET